MGPILRSGIIALLLGLAACAPQYAVVENTQQQIGPLGVNPTQQWNEVPKTHSIGRKPTWTVNGVTLDSLTFFVDVKDGEALLSSQGKEDKSYPTYASDMLPHELVEMVEKTFAVELSANISESGELAPVTFGGQPGFEFEFRYITPDELKRRAYVIGAIKNETLNVVVFQAAALHYFDKILPSARSMLRGASVE
ncbi:MAG: hypothetical protein AAF384_07235 [Pseudomonadota bacterium]